MTHTKVKCTPIFDRLPFLLDQHTVAHCPLFAQQDFQYTKSFLLSYRNNSATFNAYRREAERFLQWAWHIRNASLLKFKGKDIEAYLKFCQNPPFEWIGTKKVSRFLTNEQGKRVANSLWRPFVATITKAATRKGQQPDPSHYLLSRKSLREIFTIVSSLYEFLIQEEVAALNPTKQIHQKSYYFESEQYQSKIRRLSALQWDYVIETAQMMAKKSLRHERTLFIVTILYSLYLRISELSASTRWTPTMGDFQRDADGLWWFITVGKGNKKRDITVSNDLLAALKRYRVAFGMTPLPSPGESTPLIWKQRGKGAIRSTSQIRIIVQHCFDKAIAHLRKDGLPEEADSLSAATVHWLRHTGISDDVKIRPREHVRDDAGHSAKIIDTYLDTTRRDRHESGQHKRTKPESLY